MHAHTRAGIAIIGTIDALMALLAANQDHRPADHRSNPIIQRIEHVAVHTVNIQKALGVGVQKLTEDNVFFIKADGTVVYKEKVLTAIELVQQFADAASRTAGSRGKRVYFAADPQIKKGVCDKIIARLQAANVDVQDLSIGDEPAAPKADAANP